MKKLLLVLAFALMLTGCAAPPPAPAYYQPQISAEQMQQRLSLSQDLTLERQRLEQLRGLLGKVNSPEDGAAIRSKIEDQNKQIEVLEEKLARMPAVDSNAYYSPSGSSSSYRSAPCVTSYCGPVNVRGYTRKDGTYVRPHTRSRGKR